MEKNKTSDKIELRRLKKQTKSELNKLKKQTKSELNKLKKQTKQELKTYQKDKLNELNKLEKETKKKLIDLKFKERSYKLKQKLKNRSVIALNKAKFVRVEFQKEATTAIIAAFGFLIALSWRDFIKDSVDKLISTFGLHKNFYFYKFLSAVLVTIIAIIGIMIFANFKIKKEKSLN